MVRNDDDNDTISESGEYDEENSPAVIIENPPYPESLSDLEPRNDLDLGDSDFDSVANSNRNSYRSSVNEEIDYSNQPWINPRYRTEKEPTGSCSTWPIRK